MSQNKGSKNAQFKNQKKSNLPLMAGIVAIAVVAVFLYVKFSAPPATANVEYFGDPVVSPRSYVGKFISMTKVEPTVEDGKVKLPLSEVEQNSIVYFELENDEGTLVPLMAYITPSGRVFAGSSMCEPCRGRTFSLAGETLVCDTCRTTYTIEDHKFISGATACGQYPPTNMNAVVENGVIVFEHAEVLNWRIRVL